MAIWDEQEDDQQQDSQAIRQLREHSKSLEKQVKALMEERDSLRGKQREQLLSEALKSRNLPAKVAALVPEDIGTDPEAVNKWLSEYADVFGGQPAAEQEGDSGEDATPQGVSTQDVENLQAMSNLSSSATPPSALSDVAAKLQSAQSPAELDMLVLGRVRD